ncbi:MAG: hypothetical protein KC506_01345, partial [Nanoarchaeota archaeon]|nr:hypothetical protein [Nanoarchaeota archaeon]
WEIADTIKGETEAIIWPIFIYISLKDFISVGSVAFIVGLGSVAFTLFVGQYYDKKNKLFLMKLGGILYLLVWVVRIFVDTRVPLYVISLAAGFLAIMMNIPFNAIFYDRTEKIKDVGGFIATREIPSFIGRALLWIVLIFVADKFTVAFALAGLASLFFLFFRFSKLK